MSVGFVAAAATVLFIVGIIVGYIICNVQWVSFGKYEYYSYLKGHNDALEGAMEKLRRSIGGDPE